MRQLTADLFITLDGVAAADEAPAYFGYPGPELDRWVHDEAKKPQVVLMGRVTYEVLSSISRSATDPVSTRPTELPKLVISSRLREPSNGTTRDSSGRTWARRSARSGSSPVLRCAPSAARRSSRASCGWERSTVSGS